MRAILLAAASALYLSGCSATSARMTAERGDTDASLAYAAIATSLNAYEARTGVTATQVASAEALKLKAWEALAVERQTYALAGTVDLTALAAIAAEAQGPGELTMTSLLSILTIIGPQADAAFSGIVTQAIAASATNDQATLDALHAEALAMADSLKPAGA